MPSSPPPLFYDARTIRPGLTGVGEYTLNLLRELSNAGIRTRALVLPASLESMRLADQMPNVHWIPFATDYQSHPAGDWALRITIPRLLAPGEVYHGPAFAIPAGRQKFPRVVTIHDMGPFVRSEDYPARFGRYMRWIIRRSARNADRIIVPSEAVGRELAETLRVDPRRIQAIPEAPVMLASGEKLAEMAAGFAEQTSESAKFLISLGTLERRKDPLTVLAAIERLVEMMGAEAVPDWIWIGSKGHGAREILETIRASPVAGKFHHFGYVPRAAVQEAFAHAAALVFSSRYEGFGLPVLEAMAAGLPVVASDIPVMREVCAEAALYFKPGDSGMLAHALSRLIQKSGVREDLVRRGAARAAEFTWARAAEATVKVYGEAANELA